MRALIFAAILLGGLAPIPPIVPFGLEGLDTNNSSKYVNKEILPKKGDITKKIHIFFDKSSSMGVKEFSRGYRELNGLLTSSVDEFHIAVTVYAKDFVRMPVKESSDVGKNWMSMPSAINFRNTIKWIENVKIDRDATFVGGAILEALKENKEGVTYVIIGDLVINDRFSTVKHLNDLRSEGKICPSVIWVNTHTDVSNKFYKYIKESGHFFLWADEEKR